MGRKFFALVPKGADQNSELKQLLAKLKRTVVARDVEARWVAPSLWHVTIQFLGEIRSQSEEQLKEVFAAWQPNVSGIELRLQGLGAFPAAEEARVLWIGVRQDQELLQLQQELVNQLTQLGLPLGKHEFQPHLTLARFRNPVAIGDLLNLGGRKHFGDYPIGELILFESVVQGNISKYVPRFRKPI